MNKISIVQMRKNNNNKKEWTTRKMELATGPLHTTRVLLLFNEKFLSRLFSYFSESELCHLALVCKRWQQVAYRPEFWTSFTPNLHKRDLGLTTICEEGKRISPTLATVLQSFRTRGLRSVCLIACSDLDICDFIDNLPVPKKTIRAISFKRCSITNAGLEVVVEQLTKLNKLEISTCNDFTEAGLLSALNPQITSLTITDCVNVGDKCIEVIALKVPSLRELNLQAYHVTDRSLSYFKSKRDDEGLTTLRLQHCCELSNIGAINASIKFPNLSTLSLAGCKISDDAIEFISENLRGKLRSLDLAWCRGITDGALESIASQLFGLEELNLDRCARITDFGVGFLSELSALRILSLRWCCLVQDFGLRHIYHMYSLKSLSLAGCSLLTSAALTSLVQLKNLQELEVTNCPGASNELVEYFFMYLPTCSVVR